MRGGAGALWVCGSLVDTSSIDRPNTEDRHRPFSRGDIALLRPDRTATGPPQSAIEPGLVVNIDGEVEETNRVMCPHERGAE